MKVLVSRSKSFIVCRFMILAAQYNWSARTTEQILSKIFKYLNLPLAPLELSSLDRLSPRKLRRVVILCQVICQNPDYFDTIFNRFSCVPVTDLQRYIDLDRKYQASLSRTQKRKYQVC